jgi:hypothetical protein
MLGPYHVLWSYTATATPELYGCYPTLDVARRRAELVLRDRPGAIVAITVEVALGATAPGVPLAWVPTKASAVCHEPDAATAAAAAELVSDTYPMREE